MTLEFIIIATLFVSALSFSGAILLLWKKSFTHFSSSLVSFAAGVMLATALFDLLPESSEIIGSAVFVPLFFGILTFFFLERFLLWFHHHDHAHNTKPTAILILSGDGVHNIIDGVAIAAAFLTSTPLGIATTLAIAAHEIPQEIADLGLLIAGGMPKRRALFLNFLSGLTALAGAVVAYYFLQGVQSVIPHLLSFTAGMFLYIACSDLIPEMHQDFAKQRRWAQTIPFLLGIVVLWVLTTILH